ncbi:MAG: gamma-glutamylcyclotransferase family protein [Tepidisphaeraceae bacterium]
MSTKQYLFIYGSFLREAAPSSISAWCRRFRRVAGATVAGSLHDVEGYPALCLDPADAAARSDEANTGVVPDVVHGEIVSVASAGAWMRLDTYEGVDRARPARALFRRVRTIATTDTGERVECWVYACNRDLEGARRIEGGCWRTHMLLRDDIQVVPC